MLARELMQRILKIGGMWIRAEMWGKWWIILCLQGKQWSKSKITAVNGTKVIDMLMVIINFREDIILDII